MKLFTKKSKLQRVLETVKDSANVPGRVNFDPPNVGSIKALKAGLVIVGGLAGLTAGSAGISSLREHSEGATDDS
jgi:hypothetical protein